MAPSHFKESTITKELEKTMVNHREKTSFPWDRQRLFGDTTDGEAEKDLTTH